MDEEFSYYFLRQLIYYLDNTNEFTIWLAEM